MTDYKDLCADLVDALTAHGQPDDDAVGYVAGLLTRARAALAEPEPEPEGSTPQPADGEVAELVAWLRATAETLHEGSIQAPRLTRAADLLERMAPQPIPVTERLPGSKDCDAEGRCWLFFLLVGDPTWTLEHHASACSGRYYWLPVNALPQPS